MEIGIQPAGRFSSSSVTDEEERQPRFGKKKDKKDKGYKMFEEEDSEEESLVSTDDTKSPSKMKKHSKPSFKFAKKEKFYKPKEKDKDEKKEKDTKKEEKKKDDKEQKKDKLKIKIKKKGGVGLGSKPEAPAKTIPYSESAPIFSVALAVAVERSKTHDGIQLPIIVRECIDYIEEFGLGCEGIYRISGVKSKVQALKEGYNKQQPMYLGEHEPNIVAGLLKQFLRELPEPVLTQELMPKFEQASTIKNVKQKVEQFQALIQQLPAANRTLLSWVIVHMTHVIAKESQNKMSLQNVSIVLSPTMQISHRVLNVFFTYSKILFRDTVIKKYVPPIKPWTSRWSLELPESPTAIEEELHKQESLLNQLHEDLTRAKDPEKEEQLWEVQRVVTTLKRNLKRVKKIHEAAAAAERKDKEAVKEKEAAVLPPAGANGEADPSGGQTQIAAPAIEKSNVEAEKASDAAPAYPKADVIKETTETNEQTQSIDQPQTVITESSKPESSKDTETTESQKQTSESVQPQDASQQEAVDPETSKDIMQKTETSEDEVKTDVKPEDEASQAEDDAIKDEVDHEAPADAGNVTEVVEVREEHPEMVLGQTIEDMQDIKAQEAESAQQILEDFSQMKLEDRIGGIEDEELQALLSEQTAVNLEEEELIAIGDELRKKIEAERGEAERLRQEIAELQTIREGLYDDEDDDSSAASSSDESEDEEELHEVLQQLMQHNRTLETESQDLCQKIHEERQICLDVKVQIRMIQQKQQELAEIEAPSLMVF